jgi:DNA replication protein DnaC
MPMNSESAETATGPHGPVSPARLKQLRKIGMNSPKIDPRLRRVGELLPRVTEHKNEQENSIERRRAQFDARLEAEREAAAASLRESFWLRSGVFVRHARRATEGGERRNAAWRECRDRLAQALGSGILLALIGEFSVGKTQLAVDLIHQTCAAGRSARYVTAVPLLLSLRTEAHNVLIALSDYVSPSLLVIDEMGARKHSEWEDLVLTTLLDQRYGGLKDTLLLSNERPDAFLPAIGRSVEERLAECGKHLFPQGLVLCTKKNGWENMRS